MLQQISLFVFFLILELFIFSCKSKEIKDPSPPQETKPKQTIQIELDSEKNNKQYIEELVLEPTQKETFVWKEEYYLVMKEEEFYKLSKLDRPIEINQLDVPFLEACIFYAINQIRDEYGILKTQYSSTLAKAAKGHSRNMVALNFYSHESPIPGEENPKKRLNNYGINTGLITEHIYIESALQYQPGRQIIPPTENPNQIFLYESDKRPIPPHTYRSFAESVVKAWFNNIPTRRNLLNPKLMYSAVGIEHYKDSQFYQLDRFKITHIMTSDSNNP